MTKTLCTLSDYGYIHQGLALFNSIKNDDILLYYLCLDEETYVKIESIKNRKIIPIEISVFDDDELLQRLKTNDYKYFCWTLASYFCKYLMESKNCDSITYLDSDIFFHDSINFLFTEIGNKDIAIFRHRHHDYKLFNFDGYFNVGVVYFKNSSLAKHVLDWWVDAVLNKKYPPLSTCGDQKYLDMIPFFCPSNNLLIDGNIGHGAPWHWQLYKYDKYKTNKTIIWNGVEQKLLFSHFSKFKFDLVSNNYLGSSTYYQYTPAIMYTVIEELKMIHDDYFLQIKNAAMEYSL